jgi:hypothetical protein
LIVLLLYKSVSSTKMQKEADKAATGVFRSKGLSFPLTIIFTLVIAFITMSIIQLPGQPIGQALTSHPTSSPSKAPTPAAG